MGWFKGVLMLHVLQYLSLSETMPLDHAVDAFSIVSSPLVNSGDLDHNRLEEEKFDLLDRYLTDILIQPWPKGSSPLIYVESSEPSNYANDIKDAYVPEYEPEISPTPYKRSRYYRKYPWKRQNSRQTYEPENRYLCQPTKEDVFRLLVALHEARQGNRGHTVNFCNRKRPAHAVFTNIRFLGKRK